MRLQLNGKSDHAKKGGTDMNSIIYVVGLVVVVLFVAGFLGLR